MNVLIGHTVYIATNDAFISLNKILSSKATYCPLHYIYTKLDKDWMLNVFTLPISRILVNIIVYRNQKTWNNDNYSYFNPNSFIFPSLFILHQSIFIFCVGELGGPHNNSRIRCAILDSFSLYFAIASQGFWRNADCDMVERPSLKDDSLINIADYHLVTS